MFKVIHNNLLNEKIGESNFETQEHLDQHKVLHPEMWEPNCLTVVTDITEEKDEEQSLNKRTKKRNLCIKAMDLSAWPINFKQKVFAILDKAIAESPR